MNFEQAGALAEQIEREAAGTTATVQSDGMNTFTYHIDVHKPDVIQFCIRSVEQWNARKCLLSK